MQEVEAWPAAFHGYSRLPLIMTLFPASYWALCLVIVRFVSALQLCLAASTSHGLFIDFISIYSSGVFHPEELFQLNSVAWWPLHFYTRPAVGCELFADLWKGRNGRPAASFLCSGVR